MPMKKYALLAATFGLMALTSGYGQATTNELNSTISMVGLFSPASSPLVTTNVAGNVVTSIYTPKPLVITTRNILNILEAEFGASFPVGARLAYSVHSSGFLVLDSHGNLVLDVSTNGADPGYRFVVSNTAYNPAISGKTVMTTTTVSTNTLQLLTVRVPDYGIYYADGKNNNFHFTGLITLRANALVTSSNTVYKTVSFLLSGSGGGTIFNPSDGQYEKAVFTDAVWNASGVNVIQ
jgi:hypothetical protein